MTNATFRRLDALSSALLWIWIGMGLGFGALTAPLLFSQAPSREIAGRIAGMVVGRLDWAAFAVFGITLFLVFVLRWLNEIQDKDHAPLRLWSGFAVVALLMTFASAFIITPKLQEIRARIQVPLETLAPEHPDRAAYDKAHGASRQLFFLRLILAAGLAATTGGLPLKDEPSPRELEDVEDSRV